MRPEKRILLVDDDAALRESLAEQLQLLGKVSTVQAASAAEALTLLDRGPFDAVLLDVGLPDMDGRELCRHLRREGMRCPILMLTAADDPTAGDGASGAVAKPVRVGVLLARLRTQLERSEQAGITIGPYVFRPGARLLVDERTDRTIRLTEKETAILAHLHRAAGRIVARDALLGEVWGYNDGVTTHTLETHVYRLRQKIEADPNRAEILVTEPGGYRLGA
jgi:DNA-binding response OmpR family regulator